VTQADRVLLDTIGERFRNHPGRIAKQALHHVTDILGRTDWVTGPGDDTALIHHAQGDVLAAGEAIYPPFVAADPFGAGVGAVVANVNDVAAMGGRPLGIVNTVVASDEIVRSVLAGLRRAADLYGVPVVGGHLTLSDGAPSLSAFAVGAVNAPLLASNVAPGQALLLAACFDGQLREDFPFYPSFEQRGTRVRGDLDLLPQLAERGDCVAAKDVSMAGLLGTLAMLLQPTGNGVVVHLDQLPRPPDVPVETWLDVFPSYAFLLCGPPDRAHDCIAAFAERGLACAQVGVIDDTGILRARSGTEAATLLTDTSTSATGLSSPPRLAHERR
jgi:selenophosphate synthetase-related protein